MITQCPICNKDLKIIDNYLRCPDIADVFVSHYIVVPNIAGTWTRNTKAIEVGNYRVFQDRNDSYSCFQEIIRDIRGVKSGVKSLFHIPKVSDEKAISMLKNINMYLIML